MFHQVREDIPDAPDWLSEDAVKKWNEVWPLLDPFAVDAVRHADLVAIYCEAYATWRDAIEQLKNGSTVAWPAASATPRRQSCWSTSISRPASRMP